MFSPIYVLNEVLGRPDGSILVVFYPSGHKSKSNVSVNHKLLILCTLFGQFFDKHYREAQTRLMLRILKPLRGAAPIK